MDDKSALFKDAHIAVEHFGWKIVGRNGVRTLVDPNGKYETPPAFSALAESHLPSLLREDYED